MHRAREERRRRRRMKSFWVFVTVTVVVLNALCWSGVEGGSYNCFIDAGNGTTYNLTALS